MALSDLVDNPPSAGPNRRCAIYNLKQNLPEAEVLALTKLLNDPRWSAPALTNALLSEGHDVSKRSVERHRRHDCSCTEEK